MFRSLLEGNHVDTVETAVIPVLLGRGRRLLPHTERSWRLELAGQRVYEKSGIVLLEYRVSGAMKVTNPVG